MRSVRAAHLVVLLTVIFAGEVAAHDGVPGPGQEFRCLDLLEQGHIYCGGTVLGSGDLEGAGQYSPGQTAYDENLYEYDRNWCGWSQRLAAREAIEELDIPTVALRPEAEYTGPVDDVESTGGGFAIGTGVLVEEYQLEANSDPAELPAATDERDSEDWLPSGHDDHYDAALRDALKTPKQAEAYPELSGRPGPQIERLARRAATGRWEELRRLNLYRVAERLINGELVQQGLETAAYQRSLAAEAEVVARPRADQQLLLAAAVTLDELGSVMARAANRLRGWAEERESTWTR